ncbi:MAG: arylesterase [Syntrophales bacterium]|jgi:lysophospholipase L1-like esterase
MISRKYIVLVFLLLAIIAGDSQVACSDDVKLPRLANNAVILAFGDSLTYGTGAEQTESYPAVLEQLIGRRVVNAGIPGEETGEGLSRLPQVLQKEKPALMIICHGGNDLLRLLNQQQAANNLRDMIRLAQKQGVAVVLIAVPTPDMFLSPTHMYREIAKDLAVPLEDEIIFAVLADGSLRSDYIHPNAAGYRRIAEALATLLRESGAI